MRSNIPSLLALTAVLATVFATSRARAEDTPPSEPARADYLFPGHGNLGASVATGAPFAAIGELSVGLGDRFAAGAIVGAGPFKGGVVAGLRPRGDIIHVGPLRLGAEMPVL